MYSDTFLIKASNWFNPGREEYPKRDQAVSGEFVSKEL